MPDPIVDVLGAAGIRAVAAARRLGVFDALRDGPLTSAETARRLNADPRGIHLLLDALEVRGYVTRNDGHYATSSPDLGPAFELWETIVFELWKDLEQSIRDGRPPLDFYQWLERHPDALQSFQTLQRTIARGMAGEVVASIEIAPAARRLIDVGGSHAEYSAVFCRSHPELSATVFDLPRALESGREHASDRVLLQAGNFLTDDLGAGYDVALLMSVVHGHVPDLNIALLRNVNAALNPGGDVVILEQLAGADVQTDPFNPIFSLNLFHLQGGQTYSFAEIARWLTAAGFTDPRRIDLRESPGDSLIVAKKPEQ